MQLTVMAKIRIESPARDVFARIVDHRELTRYFIGSSTGPIEENARLIWTFPEFDEQCAVRVIQVIPERLISFVWDPETTVIITVEEQPDESTLVTVTEGEKEFSEQNLKWFGENTGGWMNFLDCLKAFSEYGINLRRGAFDYLRQQGVKQHGDER